MYSSKQVNFHNFFNGLLTKPYFKTHLSPGDFPNQKILEVNKVNVLAVGVTPEEIFQAFTSCVSSPIPQIPVDTTSHLRRQHFLCGDASVLLLESLTSTPEAQEELEVILEGEREWSYPMRSSGLFSYHVLGRQYGRDEQSFSNEPHFLLSGPRPVQVPSDKLSRLPMFNLDTISESKKQFKYRLYNRFRERELAVVRDKSYLAGYHEGYKTKSYERELQERKEREARSSNYHQGYQDGKTEGLRQANIPRGLNDQYHQGYQEGKAEGFRQARGFDPNKQQLAQDLSESQENTKASLQNLDICHSKLTDCLKDLSKLQKSQPGQRELDEAFARGLQEGINTSRN